MGSHCAIETEEDVKRKVTRSVRGPQADGFEPVGLDGVPRTEEVLYSASDVNPAFRYFTPG